MIQNGRVWIDKNREPERIQAKNIIELRGKEKRKDYFFVCVKRTMRFRSVGFVNTDRIYQREYAQKTKNMILGVMDRKNHGNGMKFSRSSFKEENQCWQLRLAPRTSQEILAQNQDKRTAIGIFFFQISITSRM